ncbi:MAG TPA: histidine kinase [Terriglobales bacterium]|nr:histidine kinase [Terriglobales bacterium]
MRNLTSSLAQAGRADLSALDKGVGLVCLASIAAWGFIAISGGLSMYELARSLGHETSFRMNFVIPGVNYLIFAFLTPFVFFLARRHPIQRNNWPRQAMLYLTGGLGFTVAHVGLRCLYPLWDPRINDYTSAFWNSTTHAFQIKWILIERLFLYYMVDDIATAYLAIVLIAHAVWYYQSFREREIRATQLETQLTKARLKALKSQMQPHFLFNTMHSISALMLTDVAAADKMITRLSDFLRLNLENDDVQFTALNRELEFVNSYLEIEKVRFEDRLNLRFSIDPNTFDAQVPHLLLQPLVENAIQHGIARLAQGGDLAISSSRDGDQLNITVRDNGPGLTKTERSKLIGGLGLRATRERLQTIYGNDHTFEIRSRASGGVEVEFRIPFRGDSRPILVTEPFHQEAANSH